MLRKNLFPGKYIQGVGAFKELPFLIEMFGRKGLILASPTTYQKNLPALGMDLYSRDLPIERFAGECCEKEILRLSEILRKKNVDVLIGMGGGKTIDTAKIAADRANIPVIIVPTIASTDAPCSGCAVLYSEQGIFESVSYQKMNPSAVLVDTGMIVKAPIRFFVSGMGDALATWFEARSCNNTQSENACGGLSTMVGLNIAKLCYETLLEYGVTAKIAAERQIVTSAVERIIEANILLSGIGFESGGLASAHSIHNGLTVMEETHEYYHGEKVAFGVLAGLQLNDSPPEESETVYAFCEAVGLPTTLADIGIRNVDSNSLMSVSIKACAQGESIHHEAGEITPERIFDAILAADAIGEFRKKGRRNVLL